MCLRHCHKVHLICTKNKKVREGSRPNLCIEQLQQWRPRPAARCPSLFAGSEFAGCCSAKPVLLLVLRGVSSLQFFTSWLLQPISVIQETKSGIVIYEFLIDMFVGFLS